MAKREAELAKVSANRTRIDAAHTNQTARTAKLAAMSNADGGTDEDNDEFYNADGEEEDEFYNADGSKKVNGVSLFIGIALGVGLLYAIHKYGKKA